MGKLPNRTAARTIDAKGLVVAPGFIDMHNHSDNVILADGDAQSMVRMGVTSMILGEGTSAAPTARFPKFTDYWAALLKGGVATNIGSYVSSSVVFTTAHGEKEGPATPAEVEKMREIVGRRCRTARSASRLRCISRPVSGFRPNELADMAKTAAEYGGIYSTHIRDEGETVFQAVSEAIEIARRAGTQVDILHLKIAHQKLWNQMPELIGLIQNARNEGLDIQAHIYPYTVGQNAGLRNIIPPWAHEGGNDAMLKRLKDPSLRARLEKDITQGIPGWYNHYTAVGSDWSRIQIGGVANPAYQKYVGQARERNDRGQEEAVARRALRNADRQQRRRAGAVLPATRTGHELRDEAAVRQLRLRRIGHEHRRPSAARSPHPRAYGTYARIMGRYVREMKMLTLEEAVRKATSHNAAKVRIYDRGILRPGMWADVAVFNPDTIIDKATFENPHQYAVGSST